MPLNYISWHTGIDHKLLTLIVTLDIINLNSHYLNVTFTHLLLYSALFN